MHPDDLTMNYPTFHPHSLGILSDPVTGWMLLVPPTQPPGSVFLVVSFCLFIFFPSVHCCCCWWWWCGCRITFTHRVLIVTLGELCGHVCAYERRQLSPRQLTITLYVIEPEATSCLPRAAFIDPKGHRQCTSDDGYQTRSGPVRSFFVPVWFIYILVFMYWCLPVCWWLL